MASVSGSAAVGVAVGADSDLYRFSKNNGAGWSLYLWLGAVAFILLVAFGGRKR